MSPVFGERVVVVFGVEEKFVSGEKLGVPSAINRLAKILQIRPPTDLLTYCDLQRKIYTLTALAISLVSYAR